MRGNLRRRRKRRKRQRPCQGRGGGRGRGRPEAGGKRAQRRRGPHLSNDMGIWREINYIFISLLHWPCVVFGEFIVYFHFLCVLHLHYSNH